MANLMDYMAWRGEFGLDASPWNEVDALAMANLSYIDFEGISNAGGRTLAEAKQMELARITDVADFESRKAQFEAMADSRRFGEIRMHHFISLTDVEKQIQFSATCYDLPDGTLCVAFRGTDGTFVGWREDFNMSWQSTVPAQEAAVLYLSRAAELDQRPIRLVGHSKGGNLAAYAAACCETKVQDRLLEIDSFDGPGMDPEIFDGEGYQRIAGRIRSFVPQTSVVGMLMEYHRNYTVVFSDASGINQHDPLTWQVLGPHFVEAEKRSTASILTETTLRQWLRELSEEKRRQFVNSLFSLLEATGASTFDQIKQDKLGAIMSMKKMISSMPREQRESVWNALMELLKAGSDNVMQETIKTLKTKLETVASALGQDKKPEGQDA